MAPSNSSRVIGARTTAINTLVPQSDHPVPAKAAHLARHPLWRLAELFDVRPVDLFPAAGMSDVL